MSDARLEDIPTCLAKVKRASWGQNYLTIDFVVGVYGLDDANLIEKFLLDGSPAQHLATIGGLGLTFLHQRSPPVALEAVADRIGVPIMCLQEAPRGSVRVFYTNPGPSCGTVDSA